MSPFVGSSQQLCGTDAHISQGNAVLVIITNDVIIIINIRW